MKELIRSWFYRYFSDPQVFILGFLLLLGFAFVLFLGNTLIPVFAAVVIAYLLDGMVTRLHRWRIPRKIGVTVVFVLFMVGLFLVIIVLLPLLSRQIGQLLQQLPSMVASAQKELMQLPERYPEVISEIQIEQIIGFLGPELSKVGQRILSLSLASVRGFISLLVYVILVPLLVFFFLKDKLKILAWFKNILPDDPRLATEVWVEVNQQVSNYVRGKIWEIIIVWATSYVTFAFLHMQFALLLSLFVGLSVLVPYIGVTVMFLPVALIAYFQWGLGSEWVYAVAAYAIIQTFDGNLLAPLLLSGVVNLHPVAIIVAVLVFGGLWGVWGLFFAIPLATLVEAVLKAWFRRHKQPPGGEEELQTGGI